MSTAFTGTACLEQYTHDTPHRFYFLAFYCRAVPSTVARARLRDAGDHLIGRSGPSAVLTTPSLTTLRRTRCARMPVTGPYRRQECSPMRRRPRAARQILSRSRVSDLAAPVGSRSLDGMARASRTSRPPRARGCRQERTSRCTRRRPRRRAGARIQRVCCRAICRLRWRRPSTASAPAFPSDLGLAPRVSPPRSSPFVPCRALCHAIRGPCVRLRESPTALDRSGGARGRRE